MEGVVVVNEEEADSHSVLTHLALDVSNVGRRDICPGNVPTRVVVEVRVVVPLQNVSNAERRVTSLGSAPREVVTNVSIAKRRVTSHGTVRPSAR